MKQPNTDGILCFFPDGYVEPRVAFWQKFQDIIHSLVPVIKEMPTEAFVGGQFGSGTTNFPQWRQSRLDFFEHWLSVLAQLEELSRKQLQREAFTADEISFIRGTLEGVDNYAGVRTYFRWYPRLYLSSWFFPSTAPSEIWEPVVTDIHTNNSSLTDIGVDPGSILHSAVGNVNTLVMMIEHDGEAPCFFVGPVMSHYTFETPVGERLTDDAWKDQLSAKRTPTLPEWTDVYMAP